MEGLVAYAMRDLEKLPVREQSGNVDCGVECIKAFDCNSTPLSHQFVQHSLAQPVTQCLYPLEPGGDNQVPLKLNKHSVCRLLLPAKDIINTTSLTFQLQPLQARQSGLG